MLSLDIGLFLIRSQCRDLSVTTRGTMIQSKSFIQFIAIASSITGIVAMTAILSDYAGMVKIDIGSSGVQLQIEGDAHRK